MVRRASGKQSSLTLGKLLKRLGPGFIAGTSDDDPSAIGTYALGGAFNWPRSLSRAPGEEPQFYWVIVASVLCGLLVNLLPFPPFKMLLYTAVLNGTPAVVALVYYSLRG